VTTVTETPITVAYRCADLIAFYQDTFHTQTQTALSSEVISSSSESGGMTSSSSEVTSSSESDVMTSSSSSSVVCMALDECRVYACLSLLEPLVAYGDKLKQAPP
jgi:uncharacterized glyoxalase superfamily protein PhnB